MSRLVLVLLAVSVALAAARSNPNTLKTNRIEQMRRGPPPVTRSTSRALNVDWFTQKLNHFDALDTRNWQQRYFYSSDEYRTGGPIFLFISGEWESNGYQITDSFIGEMAAEHGAFMIDLEHRFYGASRPTQNITTANLQFCNSEQALEDAAVFAQFMMDNSAFDLTGPWFVFGGSYSANLAAWARAKYPHLFFAAHASSGPVKAQLDFLEYYEVVNDALFAANPNCPAIIEQGMNELFAMVQGGNAEAVSSLFNICDTIDLSNPDDVMNLYSYISGFFAGEVQYARGGNLNLICNQVIAGQDSPLSTLAEIIRDAYSPYCISATNDEVLNYYRDDVLYSGDSARQWFYQACVEFGYWQSLTSADQPFGQVIPVEFSLLWCSVVYGPEFTKELNEAGIARTNLMNGGLTPDVSRVLYTHGSIDPWHALGLQTDLNADSPVIMIEGESHCRDIGSPSFIDSQALKDARVSIAEVIRGWVAAAKNGAK